MTKYSFVIMLVFSTIAMSCTKEIELPTSSGRIVFELPKTKSQLPSGDNVNDLNVWVFNSKGTLEKQYYFDSKDIALKGLSFDISLINGESYNIYSCANMGYAIKEQALSQILAQRYFLAYPDEYSTGIPMSGILENALADENFTFTVPLRRMMARVSIQMDRSALDKDATIKVHSVSVGNCAKSALIFKSSRALSDDDFFTPGFYLDLNQCAPLNTYDENGRSGSVETYLLENVIGKQSYTLSSFIHIVMEYSSPEYPPEASRRLIYHFHPGEKGTWDIYRNKHYHVIVLPEGDGMSHLGTWEVEF